MRSDGNAAVLREAGAAKTNVDRDLSVSTAPRDEVAVTKVLLSSTEVYPVQILH